MTVHLIVAGIIRRDGDVLLVRQQGPEDPRAHWALPGGRVEAGESLRAALIREVREETGLTVLDPGPLVNVTETRNDGAPRRSPGDLPGPGERALALVFAVRRWEGEIACADPDCFVSEAAFVPLPEAIRRLGELPFPAMREPAIAHLSGAAEPGILWAYLRGDDGEDTLEGV